MYNDSISLKARNVNRLQIIYCAKSLKIGALTQMLDINDLKKSDFYYELPEELIAQTPVEPRNASRLMVLDRRTGTISLDAFRDSTGVRAISSSGSS